MFPNAAVYNCPVIGTFCPLLQPLVALSLPLSTSSIVMSRQLLMTRSSYLCMCSTNTFTLLSGLQLTQAHSGLSLSQCHTVQSPYLYPLLRSSQNAPCAPQSDNPGHRVDPDRVHTKHPRNQHNYRRHHLKAFKPNGFISHTTIIKRTRDD